jgi:putative addiction module killer protein
MRIHFGPGYRVYFARRGRLLLILLIGGTKASQGRDIKKARAIAERLKE